MVCCSFRAQPALTNVKIWCSSRSRVNWGDRENNSHHHSSSMANGILQRFLAQRWGRIHPLSNDFRPISSYACYETVEDDDKPSAVCSLGDTCCCFFCSRAAGNSALLLLCSFLLLMLPQCLVPLVAALPAFHAERSILPFTAAASLTVIAAAAPNAVAAGASAKSPDVATGNTERTATASARTAAAQVRKERNGPLGTARSSSAAASPAPGDCLPILGFSAAPPRDRRFKGTLSFCKEHQKNTCCERKHTDEILRKYFASLEGRIPFDDENFGVSSPPSDCRSYTAAALCARCDARVGTGSMTRTNGPLLCRSFCIKWYTACKDEFFAAAPPGTPHPLTFCSPNSLICSPLWQITEDGSEFCRMVGFEEAMDARNCSSNDSTANKSAGAKSRTAGTTDVAIVEKELHFKGLADVGDGDDYVEDSAAACYDGIPAAVVLGAAQPPVAPPEAPPAHSSQESTESFMNQFWRYLRFCYYRYLRRIRRFFYKVSAHPAFWLLLLVLVHFIYRALLRVDFSISRLRMYVTRARFLFHSPSASYMAAASRKDFSTCGSRPHAAENAPHWRGDEFWSGTSGSSGQSGQPEARVYNLETTALGRVTGLYSDACMIQNNQDNSTTSPTSANFDVKHNVPNNISRAAAVRCASSNTVSQRIHTGATANKNSHSDDEEQEILTEEQMRELLEN